MSKQNLPVQIHAHSHALEIELPKSLDRDTRSRLLAIVRTGTPENTLKAYASDLRYFWGWFLASYPDKSERIPYYPIELEVVLTFIADHAVGLPEETEERLNSIIVHKNGKRILKLKAKPGTHKPSTIRRRLATISRMHRPYANDLNPVKHSSVKEILKKYGLALAKHSAGQGEKSSIRRKSAMTLDILKAMLETCDESIKGARDRAILSVMFDSGGRRRSEMANLHIDRLVEVDGGYLIDIGISKSHQDIEPDWKPIIGQSADHLREWLEKSGVNEGYIFRSFTRSGNLRTSISSRAIANMIKERAGLAGYNGEDFGGHSPRAGFLTESAMQGHNIFEAMELSGHRSVEVAKLYYRPADILKNTTAGLLSNPGKNKA